MDDELIDIVDKDDRVIGQRLRSELTSENRCQGRAVNAFLVNANGELWIPRRTAHKAMFPLHLDMSCAGHVQSGEDYETALRRELAEELNLDLDTLPWRLLAHLSPYTDGVSMFMQAYEIRFDQTPHWNEDDFIDAHWLTADALAAQIQQGAQTKPDLPRLIKRFYHT